MRKQPSSENVKPESTKKGVPKESNVVQRKLESANSRLGKAMALASETEAKLKEIKGKSSEDPEGSVISSNSAQRFQQNINTLNERREGASLKTLKNFKRQRRTIIETTSFQVFENEVEKIIEEGKAGPVQEDQEYDEYEEEPKHTSGKFIFEDPEFGSIDKDPSGSKSLGPNLTEQVNNLSWPRISDIANMGKAGFIDNAGDVSSLENSFWLKKIIQGQCENREFLNALILVASHWDLFTRVFNPAFETFFKHGLYSFKFYKNTNQIYYVVVDDKIPAIQRDNGEYVPFGARSEVNSEYWISLIEKAYAKLHMSYESICSPILKLHDHFYSLTGIIAETIPLDPSFIDRPLFWELLKNFKQYKLPMACIKDSQKEEEGALPVVNGHIYIIVDVFEDEERNVIKIADPWANGPQLTDDQETVGLNNIDFETFLDTFNKFLLVKDFPENWKGIKFDCEILGSKGGPNPQSNLWVENPQYIFEVTDKEEGNMILRMNKYLGPQSLQNETTGSPFGFAVISLLSNELRVKTPDLKRVVNITRGAEGDNWVCANLKLGKGKYSLIPFTVEKGETAFFFCEIFFDFKENLIQFMFKPTDKILEPSFVNVPALKGRVLKNTIRLQDFEGSIVGGVKDSTLLLIPHTTSKIIYKEGVVPKTNMQKTVKDGKLLRVNSLTKSSQNRLYDTKLDGQSEYELTAALLGLDPGHNRPSLKDGQSVREGGEAAEANGEIDYEILQSLEDVVDLNDYGLTDIGLEAILDTIIQTKQIRVLKLAGNKITDNTILNLVDKLELSHHFELEELDLSNNSLTKLSGDLVLGMVKTFKNLTKVDISGNKDLPDAMSNKIKFTLNRK